MNQVNQENQEEKLNIARAFSKVSGVYDMGRNRFFSDFGAIAASKMDIKPGSSVLDIATGRGAFLYRACDRIGASGRVVGIDLAEGMIESTSGDIEEKGLSIELYQMDAESLDFEDGTFDYVYCGFSIFFFPDLQKALSEVYRVLKPGGKFGVSTFSSFMEEDEEWLWKLTEKYLEAMGDKSDVEDEEESSPVFDTAEGLTEIFINAGFREIEVSKEKMEYFYTEDEWWSELFTHGWILTLDRFSEEALKLFKSEVFAKLKQLKGADGIRKTIWGLFSFGLK